MPISDEQFRLWCKSQTAEPVCTMEIDYQDEDGGEPVTQTLLVSNRPYRLGSGRYYAVLQTVPEFNRELGGDRHGVYSSSYGTAQLDARGGEFDWLLDAAIDGSEARFKYGDISWPIDDHRLLFAAKMVSVQRADDETLEIQIQDTGVLLNKSISGQVLVGGTGPNADRVRSFNFGYVRQVECYLVDQSSLTWTHSDTGENTVAIDVQVRMESVGFTDNGDGTVTLDATPPTSGIVTATVVALPPDADPSDTTAIKVSDLLNVAVGIRSGLTAAGLYAGPHATFVVGDDQDYPNGVNVNETRNTLDFLADAAVTGQFSWAITRNGQFTYLRIRPNDVATLPMVAFDITKDDIFYKEGISVEHEPPGYYRIRATANKNWKLTDDIAGDVIDSEQYATVTRAGVPFEQDDAVGDTYADRPELYDLTLVESPVIDTWISDADDDTALSVLASWAEVERFNGLPWLERVTHTVGMEFYDKELGDVANLIFDRFGYDAGELTQVIGIRMKPTDGKIELTLLRRRLSQPYPEGWVRVTTAEQGATPSAFVEDSDSPEDVIQPGIDLSFGGSPWSPGSLAGGGGGSGGSGTGPGITPLFEPIPPHDALAGYVVFLSHFDGTDGSTAYIDETGRHTFGNTVATMSTSASKFGVSSLRGFGLTSAVTLLSNMSDFNFGSGEWCIEFWMRPTTADLSGFAAPIDFRPAGTDGAYPALYFNSGQLIYNVNASDRIFSGAIFVADTWYFVALNKTAIGTKLFINGTEVGGGFSDSVTYGDGEPRLLHNSGGSVGMTGYLDEVRITKGASRYSADFTPPSAPFPYP